MNNSTDELHIVCATQSKVVWFGLLGFNASATARVISRQWNDDDEISFLVEETGAPGGNHQPTASIVTDETFHTSKVVRWL